MLVGLAAAFFVISGSAVLYAAARIEQKTNRAANTSELREFLRNDAGEYVIALAIAVVTGAIGVIILLAGMGWFVC